MKKIFTTKIILLSFFFLIVPVLFFAGKAEAQQVCDVTGTNFRVTKNGGPGGDDFYEEDDRPYVYIDVQTNGNCAGQTLNFSLYRYQPAVPLAGLSEAFFYVAAMNSRPIVVQQPEFTIAMRAGEENCLTAQDPDCTYFFRATSLGQLIYTQVQTFAYDCDGFILGQQSCDNGADWSYEQIIPSGNVLEIDPHHGSGNTEGNSGVTPPSGTDDDDNAVSVITLGLENPLAGTVDNLDGFIQKIVYFIVKFSIPLIAIVIVYAGFLFVSARGESAKLDKAKAMLTYALIGGLILFAAWMVADAIKDILINYS